MSMPFPRMMVFPIGCVVLVAKDGGEYKIDTFTAVGQINHQGMKQIEAKIFTTANEDLDTGEWYASAGVPYVAMPSNGTIRHQYVAYKMTASSPNDPSVVGEALGTDEFCHPMLENYYYYYVKSSTMRIRGARRTRSAKKSSAKKSGSKESGKKKTTKKKTSKKKS